MYNEQRVEINLMTPLQIALIIAKLAGIVSWKWWIILLPIEISLGIILFVFIIALIIATFEE